MLHLRRAPWLAAGLLLALVWPRSLRAQAERIEAAWQAVQFDLASFDEVVSLVRDHHYLPAIPPRAWATAASGALKSLDPPLELLPQPLYQKLARQTATAALVAGEQVAVPACGEALAKVVVLRRDRSARVAPSSVAELRAQREARRAMHRDLLAAWDLGPPDRPTMDCLMGAMAARLASDPTPSQVDDAADPQWRAQAISRFWRQAASHFLDAMDAHGGLIPTAVFTALERESVEQRNVDVGLVAASNGSVTRVQRVERGSPAAEAGILKGDILIEINGSAVATWGGWQLSAALEGPPNSQVTVTVQSGKGPKRKLVLVRRAVVHSNVVGYARGQGTGVAVVRVPSFASGTAPALSEALQDVATESQAPVRAAVLDLRGNTGGWVKEAVAFADRWLTKGIIATQNYRDGDPDAFSAALQPDDLQVPVVALVDGECRSACELVAAALQDHDRSVTVGQPTYGKGSVQAVIDAKRGPWAVLVTIAVYRGPLGRSLQALGVQPEVIVQGVGSASHVSVREVDLPTALRPAGEVPLHRSALATEGLASCVAQRATQAELWRLKMKRQDPQLLAAIDHADCLAGDPAGQ